LILKIRRKRKPTRVFLCMSLVTKDDGDGYSGGVKMDLLKVCRS
jgi:hypothetical protein